MSWVARASRAVRRESEQERDARKKLEEYFRVTKYECRQLKGTCYTIEKERCFKHGVAFFGRLLGEPYKEWTLPMVTCTKYQLWPLVDACRDKSMATPPSADELVIDCLFLLCPAVTMYAD